MDEKMINIIKKQHLDNYYRAIIDTIENNSNALVDDDIVSLVRKPPLDSMDVLKNKFLDLAKKYKIVLNTDKLDNNLDQFRIDIRNICLKIKNMRIDSLKKIINAKKDDKNEVISLFKKDFLPVNKIIRKFMKDQMLLCLEKNIIDNCNLVFQEGVLENVIEKYIFDLTKYIKGVYIRQFMENFDIKMLVKEITLINSIKEQSDRYLFTLNNSRLLNELD